MFIEIQNHSVWEIFTVTSSLLLILGHNLWLVAKNEFDELKVEVITSDKFPESDTAVKTERIADFRAYTKTDSIKITDYKTEGNSLVASLKNSKNVDLIGLELYPHPISLEAEKFAGYIASEDAISFTEPQFVKGETILPQRESYAKFAKVLVDNSSFDKIIGQKFEIILQSDPSLVQSGNDLKVQVLFDGKPVKGLRVSAGAEKLKEGKYFSHARTDENGLASLKISDSGLWFVRTHLIRLHKDTDNFEWESFWASITFQASI